MPATIRIPIDYEAIAAFCRRHGIVELALFGSVLRDDFRPDSDVDVLVSFAPDARPTLFDLVDMQDELRSLFGREVDLLTRRGVEASRNPERRQAILSSAERLYAA
jgi:predicted nucleotidyltransferase